MSIKDGPGEGTWSVFAQKVVEERDDARAENAQLRQEYENLIEAATNRDLVRRQTIDGLRAENERLRAEVADERAESERLCSALEEVMGACGPACRSDCDAYYVAKKALDGVKEKP